MRLLMLMAVLALPAHAQVYKWVDEDGVTHFGSSPPAAQHEQVEVGQTNTSRSASPRYYDAESLSRERHRRPGGSNIHTLDGSDLPGENSDGYICQGAKNRLKSAQERWEKVKRNGYTQSQRQYYEQLIVERARHRDNICR